MKRWPKYKNRDFSVSTSIDRQGLLGGTLRQLVMSLTVVVEGNQFRNHCVVQCLSVSIDNRGLHMGSSQDWDSHLGTLNMTCRNMNL